MTALLIIPIFGFVAFAIDTSYLALNKTQLQATADAAAHAAVVELPISLNVDLVASKYAAANYPQGGKNLVVTAVAGRWDPDYRTFTASTDLTLSQANAVRVTVRRNNLNFFFAPVMGINTTDVEAMAIAYKPTGIGSRFLLDDEILDSDIPVIETLARKYGMDKEKIISDNNGDWFIDLPPGEILELPTGQVGDEGLFDIMANDGTGRPTFPFGSDSNPSLADFLNYNEDSSSWRYQLISKSKLDPLPGVGRWNQPSRYQELVNPDFIHVSPIYKSDVSALDGVGEPVNKGVNALGWRRGLLAFKIIGVGADPDGSGSVLPNLIIEIMDPSDIDLNALEPTKNSNSAPKIVR